MCRCQIRRIVSFVLELGTLQQICLVEWFKKIFFNAFAMSLEEALCLMRETELVSYRVIEGAASYLKLRLYWHSGLECVIWPLQLEPVMVPSDWTGTMLRIINGRHQTDHCATSWVFPLLAFIPGKVSFKVKFLNAVTTMESIGDSPNLFLGWVGCHTTSQFVSVHLEV